MKNRKLSVIKRLEQREIFEVTHGLLLRAKFQSSGEIESAHEFEVYILIRKENRVWIIKR